MANFVRLRYVPAPEAYLKQRVKGNKRPKGAVNGSNSSFIMGERAKLYLTVDDNGVQTTQDVYYKVMYQTGRQRISDKLVDKVENKFKGATFTVSSTDDITWDCKL